ncbi:VENN motif pre-toxin domain-containing protein [Gilliamella sp. B14384H2]|uniref:VENN motif pre-toxin domain-containing protein n=1 Tax=unclassified Gilliamella TaxID=2685620 RepID=UPI0018DC6492|nr:MULTISPECIES: VENN motif pre-toxin domain-containing protein [unclassified Gilliamella]MBI0037598.1 VENN motif pre-toxin domain-containing protein [Gilliamella sp. B14384G10]MBI0039593.1 VENN motif pre-toxin domain-containing protein [Gilliamella sp. B14384G7]MBI0051433.1 VENN motif pre-toxin domain-containing protein [Gilliamella sp. B14384G13]MBI0053885.1 VENN motif pre-toxin domain-containing protein [Gilliamella sp. B14384H2]
MGNDFSKGVDSAVAIITSIITGDITGGLAGASTSAPWLAEQIKLHTGDNEAARLIAHSILGAVVAELQGNSGLAGGAGAVVGEIAADIIRKQLYGKEVKDLTEEEKETISALSQLASGLAVAAGGGNFGDASAAISSSKNAVENNGLSWADGGNDGNFIGIPYETGANLDSNLDAYAQGYLTEEEIIQLMDDMNSGRFMYAPFREDFKRFPEDLAILVTPYKDGSKIDINWNTGRVVRTAAPKYGQDGSTINKGQRLDSSGSEIPRNLPHELHPTETINFK